MRSAQFLCIDFEAYFDIDQRSFLRETCSEAKKFPRNSGRERMPKKFWEGKNAQEIQAKLVRHSVSNVYNVSAICGRSLRFRLELNISKDELLSGLPISGPYLMDWCAFSVAQGAAIQLSSLTL
jgi:hypothetical protein